MQVTTLRDTVEEALKSNGITIGSKDKIEPSLDTKIKDKDTIIIKRAVNIKVSVDGKELDIQSAEDNIASMLSAEGIVLNTEDKVLPGKEQELSEGLEVDVVRVEIKNTTELVPIEFKEVTKKDSKLPNTKSKVSQEGKNGEKEVVTNIVYENGIEVSRKIVSETIVKPPVDKVIVLGTFPLMPVSRSGSIMPYSRMFKAKATAYWAVRGVGKTYTASGRKAVRDPEGYSTIAVDPSIIPYGTKLFVEGYGFAIAADTGTAIKGEFIDVYFNTLKEARSWGLKYVNVYILK